MLVYFAHPIDQAPDRIKEINSIRGLLTGVGIHHYRPGAAFTLNGDTQREDLGVVDRINRVALLAADALLAFLPAGVPTLGVPAEIEEALRSDKPTLILTTGDLHLYSVQVASWADRGATVVDWAPWVAEGWKASPEVLLEILSTKPEGQLPLEVEAPPAANHRSLPPASELETFFPSEFHVKLDPGARVPSRSHDDDAGLDLAIAEDVYNLMPDEYRLVPTGVWGAVPTGWWGMITGRSSTWARHRCDVRMAVIDSGYRGELMIGLQNRGEDPVNFQAGTRLAQYVLIPTFTGHVRVLSGDEKLTDHARGENGYGSTGL